MCQIFHLSASFSSVFVLYYVVHGVFCERPLELLVSIIATIIVMLYCIVEYAVHGRYSIGENRNLKLVSISTICDKKK